MKKYLLILSIILLTAFYLLRGLSPEEKIIEINNIENQIYDLTVDPNLININYEILSINDDESKAKELISVRNGLYVSLMATFLDPDTEIKVKERIILFFNKIPGYSQTPIRITDSKKIINGKEYLDVNYAIDAYSLFDMETKLLFYQELASLQGVIFDISDKIFLANELCAAVDEGRLVYASALIDLSIDLFDPGKIRCIEQDSTMVQFLGNTTGMIKDRDVISSLGVCPMSLRRISGRNFNYSTSLRVSSWLSNVKSIDSSKIKSLNDAKNKISSTFNNIPALSRVPGSMNSLLNKYANYWVPGGNCTLLK
jgi:hypothetical protein